MYHDRIYAVACPRYARNGMEIRRTAIHRLEMRMVFLGHGYFVHDYVVKRVPQFEIEDILRLRVTHRQIEAVDFYVPIDQYAINAIGLRRRDGKRVR